MVSAKTAGKVKPSTAEASKKSKKKSNKSANKHDDPFAVDGRVWKTVDVGDELLVGAEHGGFMGLEVLEGPGLAALLNSADNTTHDDVAATPQPTKKRPREEDVAALQKQLKQLKSENKKLKKAAKKKNKAVKEEDDDADNGLASTTTTANAHLDMSAWDAYDLHPGIMAALRQCGFTAPTEIQSASLVPAIQGRCDVIGAAQTGSGKTLAFGLPIIQHLLQLRGTTTPPAPRTQANAPLRALILCPTRELALQVTDHLRVIAQPNDIWVVPLVGGISTQKQERLLKKFPEIVVATPGRLWDLMQQGHQHLVDFSQLSHFVLDEADHMLQLGHFKELSSILALIPFRRSTQQPNTTTKHNKNTNRKASKNPRHMENKKEDAVDEDVGNEHDDEHDEECSDEETHSDAPQHSTKQPTTTTKQPNRKPPLVQVFVFSATLTLPAVLRKRLKGGQGGASGSSSLQTLMDTIPFRPKPTIVDLTAERKLGDKVTESYIQCSIEERDALLYTILTVHHGRTLVFTNAISSVRRVAALLKLLGVPVLPLHASMQQRQRLKYLDRFRENENGVLVATDVAARGLDIKDVRCVIHYQIPASADVYVHRCGRTARAEQDGIAIALVTPTDSNRFASLFRAFDRPMPAVFPVNTRLLPEAHIRVRLAVRLDECQRLLDKQRNASAWRQHAAHALDMELSSSDNDGGQRNVQRHEEEGGQTRAVRKHLLDKEELRGPGDEAQARALQQQLHKRLLKPLAPGFSTKFFTGGAASALNPLKGNDDKRNDDKRNDDKRNTNKDTTNNNSIQHGSKHQYKTGNGTSRQGKQGGSRQGGLGPPNTTVTAHDKEDRKDEDEQYAAQRQAAEAAARAASLVHAATTAAAAGSSSGGSGSGTTTKSGTFKNTPRTQQASGQHSVGNHQPKGKPKGLLTLAQHRALALQQAIAKKQASKGGSSAGGGGVGGGKGGKRNRKGVLVVPEVLGRAAAGSDALTALKQHAGLL